MFAVIFEVHPAPEQWDAYLGYARMLKPELERIDGFVDNIRYRSLTRDGWILSLSSWRDEKAVVRWRTAVNHHDAQVKGRADVLLDYHLRVGQLTEDTVLPAGCSLVEQRLDETETGAATAVTLVDAKRQPESPPGSRPEDLAHWLGLDPAADSSVGWDVFEAVLTPGDLIVLSSWRDNGAANAHDAIAMLPEGSRRRRVRIVRDYGMFDRREAPQYYPGVIRSET